MEREVSTDVEWVYSKIWPEKTPCTYDVKVMRECLIEVAIDITHECGDEEATIRAYCRTVTDFLKQESKRFNTSAEY